MVAGATCSAWQTPFLSLWKFKSFNLGGLMVFKLFSVTTLSSGGSSFLKVIEVVSMAPWDGFEGGVRGNEGGYFD